MKFPDPAEIHANLNPAPGLKGGRWHCTYARNPYPAMHRHRELELNFVIGGKASYLLPGVRFDVRRYSLYWLFPGRS